MGDPTPRPGFQVPPGATEPSPQPLPRTCGLDDCAWQWMNATLVAEGPFVVLLPVPEAEGGARWPDWVRNASIVEGSARVRGILTERGGALEVAGNGTVRVQSHFWSGPSPRGNGCCAEAYLDTVWSLAPPGAPRHVGAWVEGDVAELRLVHDAHSRWCMREEAYAVEAPDPGWLDLGEAPGGGVCA